MAAVGAVMRLQIYAISIAECVQTQQRGVSQCLGNMFIHCMVWCMTLSEHTGGYNVYQDTFRSSYPSCKHKCLSFWWTWWVWRYSTVIFRWQVNSDHYKIFLIGLCKQGHSTWILPTVLGTGNWTEKCKCQPNLTVPHNTKKDSSNLLQHNIYSHTRTCLAWWAFPFWCQ